MVQLPKPFPRFFKLVDKPATVPDSELAKARPIYIDGLPTADTSTLEQKLADLEARLEALEGA